jgi:hypothetical protein
VAFLWAAKSSLVGLGLVFAGQDTNQEEHTMVAEPIDEHRDVV